MNSMFPVSLMLQCSEFYRPGGAYSNIPSNQPSPCYRHLQIVVSLEDQRSDRRQYLITCSQVDEDNFPTRQSFGQMVEAEFNAELSVVKFDHWVVLGQLPKRKIALQTQS